MSRSKKKGPFVNVKLVQKIMKQQDSGENSPLKTWARACQILPEFVGHTFEVHNGKDFVKVVVNENMVGHRLGEFSPTRKFLGHDRSGKQARKGM